MTKALTPVTRPQPKMKYIHLPKTPLQNPTCRQSESPLGWEKDLVLPKPSRMTVGGLRLPSHSKTTRGTANLAKMEAPEDLEEFVRSTSRDISQRLIYPSEQNEIESQPPAKKLQAILPKWQEISQAMEGVQVAQAAVAADLEGNVTSPPLPRYAIANFLDE